MEMLTWINPLNLTSEKPIKILYVLATMISVNCFAETFRISGEQIVFIDSPDGLSISKCIKECQALKQIYGMKKIKLGELRKSIPIANSVGSDACSLAYKAKSLIGLNTNGDQRVFCLFSDMSMVEMNSLSRYLVDNKIIIN